MGSPIGTWSFLSCATDPESPMPRLRGRNHDNLVAEPHYSRVSMMLLLGMAITNPCHMLHAGTHGRGMRCSQESEGLFPWGSLSSPNNRRHQGRF